MIGTAAPPDRVARGWLAPLACALAAAAAASIGLGDERYVSTHGDMARYLMNGTFLFDLLRDRPFDSLQTVVDYARLYYARYPALSIGHHPLLVSVAEVPSFMLFGVSVLAGRIPVIASFIVAALYLYRLVADLYDEWAGAAASLVFATSPVLAGLSQAVMSEPPAVALVVVAAYYLHRFCVTGSRRALGVFVLCAGASVWAKQLAVMAFPGFLFYAVAHLGWRRLLTRHVVIAATFLAVVVIPIVPLSAALSPANAGSIGGGVHRLAASGENQRLLAELWQSLTRQVSAPLVVLGLAGIVVAAARRRTEAWLLAPWIAATVLVVLLATRFMEVARFTVYWVPAWAAGVGILCGPGRWQRPLVAGVAALVLMQAVVLARQPLHGAGGYETAARYVVAHPHGATVLFSGDVDTGYFVFFVRKHDHERRLVVLRSDKVLTTSAMARVAVEDRIERPDQISPLLSALGVGYVVIEDRPSASQVLEWLRSELRTDRYAERLRVPIASTDLRLRDTSLVVYEVKDPPEPAPDARLDMRLPVVSREINVGLADLLNRKYFVH